MRLSTAFLAALALLTAISPCAADQYVVTGNGLNARAAPRRSADILFVIRPAVFVLAIDEAVDADGEVWVRLGGFGGIGLEQETWVAKRFLAEPATLPVYRPTHEAWIELDRGDQRMLLGLLPDGSFVHAVDARVPGYPLSCDPGQKSIASPETRYCVRRAPLTQADARVLALCGFGSEESFCNQAFFVRPDGAYCVWGDAHAKWLVLEREAGVAQSATTCEVRGARLARMRGETRAILAGLPPVPPLGGGD